MKNQNISFYCDNYQHLQKLEKSDWAIRHFELSLTVYLEVLSDYVSWIKPLHANKFDIFIHINTTFHIKYNITTFRIGILITHPSECTYRN